MLEDALISIHVGAPATQSDLLLKSVRKEQAAQNDTALHVPEVLSYRDQIITLSNQLRGAPLTSTQRQEVYKTVCSLHDSANIENIVLSSEYFLAFAPYTFKDGMLFDRSGVKSNWLRSLFPHNPCEFFITIRNPATFIPQMLGIQKQLDYESLVGRTDLLEINWYDVIARMDECNPDDHITVFLFEDAPQNWGNMVRALGGFAPNPPMQTDLDMAFSLLSRKGRRWLQSAAEAASPDEHPALIEFALENHLRPDQEFTEISLPGWDQELINGLTRNYLKDIQRIKGLTGVTLLEP